MKKVIFNSKTIICIIFIYIFLVNNKTLAATRLEGVDNFPSSYKPYIVQLQKTHPNWKFTALYTNLDWNYVIDNENIYGRNLVPISYSDSWKNTNPGEYNIEIDKGWVDCSRKAIEYAMDPRNFLNSVRIFGYEALGYEEILNNKTRSREDFIWYRIL